MEDSIQSLEEVSRTTIPVPTSSGERRGAKSLWVVVPLGILVACCALTALYSWTAGCMTFWAGNYAINNPRAECSHMNQAVAAIQTGDYDTAAQRLEWAIAQNPGNGEAYAMRGDIYQRFGEYALALADYARAIQLDPEDMTSRAARAYLLARHGGDLDQALADIEFVLKRYPGRADYLDTRAMVYFKRGAYVAAVRDAQKAIAGGEMFGHYTLGLTYQAQGKSTQAIEQFVLFLDKIGPGAEGGQAQDARTRITAMGGAVP